MFNSWSRTQKSTPRLAAGDSPTSRTANRATRRCTKPASPATSLPKIATLSSLVTRLRPELKHAPLSCVTANRHAQMTWLNDGGKGDLFAAWEEPQVARHSDRLTGGSSDAA